MLLACLRYLVTAASAVEVSSRKIHRKISAPEGCRGQSALPPVPLGVVHGCGRHGS